MAGVRAVEMDTSEPLRSSLSRSDLSIEPRVKRGFASETLGEQAKGSAS